MDSQSITAVWAAVAPNDRDFFNPEEHGVLDLIAELEPKGLSLDPSGEPQDDESRAFVAAFDARNPGMYWADRISALTWAATLQDGQSVLDTLEQNKLRLEHAF